MAPSSYNCLQLDDPLEGCFFCEPEPWRTIFTGERTRIVAGAGPLCPGYVILAPRDHIHAAAELQDGDFWDFQASYEILKRALQFQYGVGYTAYEHGRVGACLTLEAKKDFSSFCHHAHRVVIPHATDCVPQLASQFEDCHVLETPEAIRALNSDSYIFYETSTNYIPLVRRAFTKDRNISSQFMRRVLTDALKTNRRWNWADDHRIAEMVDTTSRLRGEFLGLEPLDDNLERPNGTLRKNVSIDGFAHVGKTTLARILGAGFGRPVIDTGMVFRHLALCKLQGLPAPSSERLIQSLLAPEVDPELRTIHVTEATRALSSDLGARELYAQLISTILPSLTPCILVGRDAWRFMSTSDCRIVLFSDFETRFRRRLLHTARHERSLPALPELERHIQRGDLRERQHLPPDDDPDTIRISNGRQPMRTAVQSAFEAIGT